jgi:2-polyprenyl-3-methyl-5-hydroxy-6-metoxy-1,4-benzoquinol methylase
MSTGGPIRYNTAAMNRHFDAVAAGWDGCPRRVLLAGAVAGAIRTRLPLRADWRLLDYGAGTGLLTLHLQPLVGGVVAMDSSKGMLEVLDGKARAAGMANVECRLCDLEAEEPPAGERFDAVVSAMTLHHLREPRLMLRTWAAMLRPGGWIAVADLEPEDGTFHDDPAGIFHHGFAAGDLLGWLVEAGLGEGKVETVHHIRKETPSGTREYPVFLATARKS